MRDRGKAVAVSSSNWFTDYSTFSDLPCRKHPSSSSVGICAYCLKDRLIKLVCTDCGEQRLSSCSCSDISSSYTAEIGSVGRISFLIENEKEDFIPHSNITTTKARSEASFQLRRSSSSCVDVKRSGIWRFRRLFRKKRDKDVEISGSINGDNRFDEKGEMWVVHNVGVSRSRSVGGLRGGSGFDESESGLPFNVSSIGASEANKDGHLEPAKRSSGGFSGVESVTGGPINGGRISSLMESESGLKGVKKSGFMEFDSGFSGLEDSGFIDLKLGFSSESSKPDQFSCLKSGDVFDTEYGSRVSKECDFSQELEADSFRYLRGDGISSNGSSCRITVNEKEIKKCKKSLKVWRWMFRHHHHHSSGGRKMTMYSNPERD